MATKSRVKIESRFPAAKKAAHETVQFARELALSEGKATANAKISKTDAQRGYKLPADVQKENIGFQSGKIFYDEWYGRFFEYGTVNIQAAPFMRPAARVMRKVFIGAMGTHFEGWVKRRARVR
jgi:HK97 gp10 family phage protein